MKWFSGAALAAILACGPVGSIRADDPDAQKVLDKGIKALGGEEKLGKAGAITWKSKGKITLNDEDHELSGHATAQGLDRYRTEFEAEFNGNPFKGVTVLNGDKGWRKFGEDAMELDANGVANEKRSVYLQVVPMTLVALKGKDFKVKAAGEEKVGDKPAAVLDVSAPDGKDFKLSFDKESGLPVKMVANVIGFGGQEYTQESLYDGYKDFGGIKKATKIASKRDGQKFVEVEISDFKVLDKVDPETFAEPR